MCVRALRITVLKSAGNFTHDEYPDLNTEKLQRVKCFVFTRCGICCVPAIFERRRGRLGSKISGYGQEANIDASLLRRVEPISNGAVGLPRGTLLDSFRSIVRSLLASSEVQVDSAQELLRHDYPRTSSSASTGGLE
jgi:hypothetical protein